MIPISDVVPSRTTPWVTITLIAANVLVYLYETTLSPDEVSSFIEHFAFVPADAGWLGATPAMFVHENGLHLALNVFALWIFGDNVEDQLGHGRYTAFYLLTGHAAALAELWATGDSMVPLVGASGAVAGIIGAHLVMFPASRVLVIVPASSVVDAAEVPALLVGGAWFALQMLGGLGRLTDPPTGLAALTLWTTAGGFIAGALAVRAFRRTDRQRVEWWGA